MKLIRAFKIVAVVVAVVTSGIIGLYVGLASADKEIKNAEKEFYDYDEADIGEYWCEIYDDGRTIIHTEQRFITNDDNGNLIIKVNQNEIE